MSRTAVLRDRWATRRCRVLGGAAVSDSLFLRACRGEPTRAHPGLVHAPGRALAARVPRAPRAGRHPRRHPRSRARRPRSPSSRCAATASTPRSSSPTSSCRSPRSASASRSSPARARSSPSRSARADLGAAPTARARDRHAVRARDRSRSSSSELDVPLIGFAGAPVHGRELLHRGRPDPRLSRAPNRSCTPIRRCSRAPGSARRSRARLAALPDRRGCRRGPALRQLGGRAQSASRLRALRAPRDARRSSAGSRTSACRGSTSASAPASCSTSWPAQAPTSSASTGACRSTHRRAHGWAGARCRATSTRRSASRASTPWARGATHPRRGRVARRRTSSTSATACLPETDPEVLARLVELVHEVDAV